jgi:hypothetical protein
MEGGDAIQDAAALGMDAGFEDRTDHFGQGFLLAVSGEVLESDARTRLYFGLGPANQ